MNRSATLSPKCFGCTALPATMTCRHQLSRSLTSACPITVCFASHRLIVSTTPAACLHYIVL